MPKATWSSVRLSSVVLSARLKPYERWHWRRICSQHVDNVNRSLLADSEVTVVGTTTSAGLKVNAEDASTIYADGGGVALLVSRGAKSPTNIGIGLGVAINLIDSQTRAFVEDVTVDSSAVTSSSIAFYHPTIDALTLGGRWRK